MKQSKGFKILISVLISPCLGLLAWHVLAWPAQADDRQHNPTFNEHRFREELRALERRQNPADRVREADLLLKEHWLSSQQVKAIARTIHPEDARHNFVLAAFPRTVDPEDFYEVYDTFTSFSRVFRLHDQIRRLRGPAVPPPAPVSLEPVSDEAMKDILRTLREASFDDPKKALARQILSGRPRFLSRQILDLVRAFDFDEARLEIATLGYGSVIDPENYYVVASAFSFSSTKEKLAKDIESRNGQR